jgi:NAD(P)-dependent dehydrogenase (short-subunit alcohol dehydrogenase family)
LPDLSGKVVLLTGASSGIGAALAELLLQGGARVAMLARRAERLQRLAALNPAASLAQAGDLTRARDRKSLVEAATRRWGRIDVLINNAGKGYYGDILEAGEAAWRDLFEINLFAPVLLTQLVLPIMLAQGGGLIVNIASIGALVAHAPKVTPYVASKHALLGFSRGLAKDLAGSGVRVKAVCPHLTATEFFDASPGAAAMAPEVAKYRSFMDTPQEVARGVLAQWDQEGLVLFPTGKPRQAFAKMREL